MSITPKIVNQVISNIGKVWKYSLGSFSDDKTKPYDNYVAAVRSVIFISYLVTNCFIISGVIRHWNNRSDCDEPKYKVLPVTTHVTQDRSRAPDGWRGGISKTS